MWDWFATHDRIRRPLREEAAQPPSGTQRQLVAQFEEFWQEARTADTQVASLHSSADMALESLRLTRLRYSAGEALAYRGGRCRIVSRTGRGCSR